MNSKKKIDDLQEIVKPAIVREGGAFEEYLLRVFAGCDGMCGKGGSIKVVCGEILSRRGWHTFRRNTCQLDADF